MIPNEGRDPHHDTVKRRSVTAIAVATVLLEEIDRQGKLALKLVNPLERKEGAGSSEPSDDRPPRNDRDRGDRGDRGGDRGDRSRLRESGNRDRGPPPERRPAEPVQTGDSRRKADSFEDGFDNLPKN